MTAARLQDAEYSNVTDFCDDLIDYLTVTGQSQYDETVTQLEHACQTAALAESNGYPEHIQIAALLHDIGHLLLNENDGQHDFLDEDLQHEMVGARFLLKWFGPEVSAPVALHVKAKRYLVTVDPAYAAGLSAASKRSLTIQGGPMSATELEAFERLTHAETAAALRRWDDQAKQPDGPTANLDYWRDALIRTAAAGGTLRIQQEIT